jgi:hypothetical protein
LITANTYAMSLDVKKQMKGHYGFIVMSFFHLVLGFILRR